MREKNVRTVITKTATGRPVPPAAPVAQSRRVASGQLDVGLDPGAARHRVRHLHRLRRAGSLQGSRHRSQRPRLHPGAAPRLRRRPHLGHRQHDPQAHERASGRRGLEATAQRGLLLLARSLDHRGRHRCGHRHRRKGRLRRRLATATRASSSSAASSGPSSRPRSSTSSPSSTSSSWPASCGSSGRCARAPTTRPSSSAQLDNRGLMYRFFGKWMKVDHQGMADVPRRRGLRHGLRHGHRGRPARHHRPAGHPSACPGTRSCACPSCSRPACR